MVDHQFSHVFVPGGDRAVIEQVAKLFTRREGFAEVADQPSSCPSTS